MNPSRARDVLVGLFLLAGLAAVAYLSIQVGGLTYSGPGGLTLFARFDETGGLKPRAPVEIAGVRVGRVRSIALDHDFRARVELDLDRTLTLPVDSSASIVTAGILGDRYLSVQVGGDQRLLKSGDEIAFTESALSLERLIGKLIHGTDVEK